MTRVIQQRLFKDDIVVFKHIKCNSGTFVNNMKLPIHRWFRYSAGFSASWVESILAGQDKNIVVLDPFAGSGTTLLASDKFNIKSYGIEPHPFVYRIAKAKLFWDTSIDALSNKYSEVLSYAKKQRRRNTDFPELINKCFDEETLLLLDKLKSAWIELNDNSKESELVWLAITSILRPSAFAGTAQWQYILPNKTKYKTTEPFLALEQKTNIILSDMKEYQETAEKSQALMLECDARDYFDIKDNSIDLVITSPPYANNYDYADATRFEMSFWGEVSSWGDLHEVVRKYLLRSSSQHVSKEKLNLEDLLKNTCINPIKDELEKVCYDLAEERLNHGGKKHYHTMIAAYFIDMAKVLYHLRRVCKENSKMCYVIGDSAPYGIYAPVDKWIGELAITVGFKSFTFEKIRDRNIKWKNRKHRVPLKEGRLWIMG